MCIHKDNAKDDEENNNKTTEIIAKLLPAQLQVKRNQTFPFHQDSLEAAKGEALSFLTCAALQSLGSLSHEPCPSIW